MKKIFLLIILLFSALSKANSQDAEKSEFSKEQKLLYTNIALPAGVVVYGLAKWNYGEENYSVKSEGWFQSDTKEGGADKFGHLYTAYLTSRITKSLYEQWGYSSDEAALKAALTSFILTTTIEFGDGFSSYGSSYEDLISNAVGQISAYILSTNENLNKKIDLRFEYNPINGINSDPLTDYNSSKYLVALKMAGLYSVEYRPLKYLEFHLGYYARGYDKFADRNNTQRNIYVGIGINLSQILNDFSYKKTAKIFNYYQAPYTYISQKYDFNNHENGFRN